MRGVYRRLGVTKSLFNVAVGITLRETRIKSLWLMSKTAYTAGVSVVLRDVHTVKCSLATKQQL